VRDREQIEIIKCRGKELSMERGESSDFMVHVDSK